MNRRRDRCPPHERATKWARSIITIGSALIFFVLIFQEYIYVGTVKDVPMWMYFLLAGVAIFSNDRLYNLLESYLAWKGVNTGDNRSEEKRTKDRE